MTSQPPTPRNSTVNNPDPRPEQDREIARAVVHGCITIGFAIATYLVGMASSGILQTILVVATPIVVLVGAIACLWRTYRTWQRKGRWQIWQGASWFLLATFIVTLMATAPALLE